MNLNLLSFRQIMPLPALGITAAGSERMWISLNSKESNTRFPCEVRWRQSRGGRRGFMDMSLLPGCGWGLRGKPCTPPCRGSSLPGPEEARSPVLICTYPYTGSCHWKGNIGGLIGLHRKWGRVIKCITDGTREVHFSPSVFCQEKTE